MSDHADGRRGGRFRWLLSTCLAGAVGVLAILVVIAGSTESLESDGLLSSLQRPLPSLQLPSVRVDGLRWAVPKADKLLIPSGAVATLETVQDQMRQRRGNRDYIYYKPYKRLVARLGPISKAEAQTVPAFNPYLLYASTGPADRPERPEGSPQDADVKIVELLGGTLPNEDGYELSAQEIADLVLRAMAPDEETPDLRPGFSPHGAERVTPGELLAERSQRAVPDMPPPNTSVLEKSVFEADDPADLVGSREVRVVKAQRGDTVVRLLGKMGAETWQARAMSDAARKFLPNGEIPADHEVHVTLVPAITRANRMEPVRYSVFNEAQEHILTVARNAAGEFVGSATPIDPRVARVELADDDQPQPWSLYASIYSAARRQGIPAEAVLQILRIHAYETDFRQRVRPGDSVEFFFDVKDDDKGGDGPLGDLLATSITTSGETSKFYRFRTSDGEVDYYDAKGNTSRKFLMRRPVRGENVRITSGFGMRRHPILLVAKMHTGVDWACAPGTPIMAAGTGVIEEAGRKGEYGNYIRIRHPNGYKTTYGHMQRIAAGVSEGVKVRQGQVIGYVGATGLASGPHVHFEVLVNKTFVDPMTIQVPRERQLTGKQLADFNRERMRIDSLMRRNPVSTRVAAAGAVR